MDWVGLAKVAASAATWRIIGLKSAGRTLIDALASPDENVRTIAGMSLVKGGEKALPLLRDALSQRRALATVITIIGDIGGENAHKDIEPFLNDGDAQVQKATQSVYRLSDKH